MNDSKFLPHGQCFLWDESLISLQVLGDSLIALSYFSIPITLFWFVRKRPHFDFNWVVLLFCSFIVFCGLTHTIMIWNFWNSDYLASGLLKIATAIISFITAVVLWPLVPKLLKLPTINELEIYKRRLFEIAQSLTEIAGTKVAVENLTAAQTAESLEYHLEQLQTSSLKAKSLNNSMAHFFSHFSHEVRGPLNSVVGYTDLLNLDKGLSQESRKYLDNINTSCDYITDLITEVLDYSKLVAGKLDIVSSRVAIRETLNQLSKSLAGQIAKKKLEFNVYFAETIPSHIFIDELRLKQLLSNLVGNSIKYTHSGKIEISLEWRAKDTNTGTLSFEVLDTGIGIDKTLQEKIFNPFETANSDSEVRSKSSGLGLALCRGIAKELNGSVELVHSELGVGSVFKVELNDIALHSPA